MRYNIYVGKKLVANMGEAQLQPYFIRNWDKAPLYLPIYPTDATGYSMQTIPLYEVLELEVVEITITEVK